MGICILVNGRIVVAQAGGSMKASNSVIDMLDTGRRIRKTGLGKKLQLLTHMRVILLMIRRMALEQSLKERCVMISLGKMIRKMGRGRE